jgi:hypothetical protein
MNGCLILEYPPRERLQAASIPSCVGRLPSALVYPVREVVLLSGNGKNNCR